MWFLRGKAGMSRDGVQVAECSDCVLPCAIQSSCSLHCWRSQMLEQEQVPPFPPVPSARSSRPLAFLPCSQSTPQSPNVHSHQLPSCGSSTTSFHWGAAKPLIPGGLEWSPSWDTIKYPPSSIVGKFEVQAFTLFTWGSFKHSWEINTKLLEQLHEEIF